jgi:TRAP-type uncharacterized transport system fused permease subunit
MRALTVQEIENMNSPELTIILINVAFIVPAYFYFYPKFAGSNGNKVALYDLLITVSVLAISYLLFADKNIQFNIVVVSLNWFWFTLLTYAVIEMPLMLWYYKKNNVWQSLK